MKLPACENIELQKHPWVRGCVNGAFSAGPDPSPVLLTDGQQMAFCVQRESRGGGGGDREGERKGRERHRDGEGGVLRFFRPLQSGGLYEGLKCLIT